MAGGWQRSRLTLGFWIGTRGHSATGLPAENRFKIRDQVETHGLSSAEMSGLARAVASGLFPSGRHLVLRLKGLLIGPTKEAVLRPSNLRLADRQVAFAPAGRLEAPRHIGPSLFNCFMAYAW